MGLPPKLKGYFETRKRKVAILQKEANKKRHLEKDQKTYTLNDFSDYSYVAKLYGEIVELENKIDNELSNRSGIQLTAEQSIRYTYEGVGFKGEKGYDKDDMARFRNKGSVRTFNNNNNDNGTTTTTGLGTTTTAPPVGGTGTGTTGTGHRSEIKAPDSDSDTDDPDPPADPPEDPPADPPTDPPADTTTKPPRRMISNGEKDYTEDEGDWFFPKVDSKGEDSDSTNIKDYQDIIDDYKNSVQNQEILSGTGNIDSHHLFYHPVIDRQLALFYLRECNLSYQSPEDRKVEPEVEYIEEDTNYFNIAIRIGYYGDRTVVSFRGTDNQQNALADVYSRGWDNEKLSDYFDFVGDEDDLKVHSGFIQTINNIYELLDTKLKGRTNIEYTGHSYGSVCCIYAYIRLLETGEQPKSIYTFGSPRLFVNDPNYPIERFNNRLDVLRFFNVFDGVSYLPTKDSQSAGAGVLGLIGGVLGYSLGSLFSNRVNNRIGVGVGGLGTGALVGRQLGNYIHIGTGVKLFPERGCRVRPENSLHYKHSGGQLPENENYIVIPKGLDVYRNLLDWENFFLKAIYNILTSKFLNSIVKEGITGYKQNTEEKNKLRAIQEISNSVDNLELSDIRKQIADNFIDNLENGYLGGDKTARDNKEGNIIYDTNTFYKRLEKATRKIASQRFREFRVSRGDVGFTDEGKEFDISFQLQNDRLVETAQNQFGEFPKIDWRQIADGGEGGDAIPYVYKQLFAKGGKGRKEWKNLLTKILKAGFVDRKLPPAIFEKKITDYITYAYVGFVAGAKVYADFKEVMKAGGYHKLISYVDSIKLLPEFISENKNDNHSITANVSGKTTDDLLQRPEETTSQEGGQQNQEGESESNPSTEAEQTTEGIPSEKVKIGNFRLSSRLNLGTHINIDDDAIPYAIPVDNAEDDSNIPTAFVVSEDGKAHLKKRTDEFTEYITGGQVVKPPLKEDSAVFYQDLLDEIEKVESEEKSDSGRRRRRIPQGGRRRRKIDRPKLVSIKTELKEKIEDEINPTYNLQQIKNNIYLDESTNGLFESRVSANEGDYSVSFRETGIKILGYYPYKNDSEIENKIVIF